MGDNTPKKMERVLRDPRPLRELDATSRGGVSIRSPWPGGRGDGRRSGRSIAPGPATGKIAAQRTIPTMQTRGPFAVNESGRALAFDARKQTLTWISSDGETEALVCERQVKGFLPFLTKTVHACGTAPILLAEKKVLTQDGNNLYVHVGPSVSLVETVGSPWIAGLGTIVMPGLERGLRAVELDAPHKHLWDLDVSRKTGGIAYSEGAQLVIVTCADTAGRSSIRRHDIATNKAGETLVVEDAEGAEVVVGPGGVAYASFTRSLAAGDVNGQLLWRKPLESRPVALAGADSSVLICEAAKDSLTDVRMRAIDATNGNELWQSNDQKLVGHPKIDSRGFVYWRRGEDLLCLDPRTGVPVFTLAVGDGEWDFAFSGKGHAIILKASLIGGTEFITIE